jgi:hypothetical protein
MLINESPTDNGIIDEVWIFNRSAYMSITASNNSIHPAARIHFLIERSSGAHTTETA